MIFNVDSLKTWVRLYDANHTVQKLEHCISVTMLIQTVCFLTTLIRLKLL